MTNPLFSLGGSQLAPQSVTNRMHASALPSIAANISSNISPIGLGPSSFRFKPSLRSCPVIRHMAGKECTKADVYLRSADRLLRNAEVSHQ